MSSSIQPLELAVRVLVTAGLAVQAIVHVHLASRYQLASPDGIGGGNLFRIEAGLAVLAALFLVLRGSRSSYLVAASVLLGGTAAVVLYRYVDLGSFGPIPSMYEPLWFFEKTLSALAEGAAGLLAAATSIRLARPRSSSPMSAGRIA